MTSVLGLSMPKIGISKDNLTSPKNVALGGIAATSLVGGGVIGALRGSPLKGLAIGGAVAAAALGAALIGNASSSGGGHWDYDPYHGDYHYHDDYDPHDHHHGPHHDPYHDDYPYPY